MPSASHSNMMKVISIFTVMLLMPVGSTAFEPAAVPSHRVMIEVEHYQLMREVCKTLHPKGLHWNGHTANIVLGYDNAVITIGCQMLNERGERVNIDTTLDG